MGAWIAFYNDERPHQALDYRTPGEVFSGGAAHGYADNASAVGTPITERPPHRTVRAEFPHTAPTSGV